MSKGITLDEHIDATYNVVKANKRENPFKEKKQTNADRIRSFSDEELAEFLPIVSDIMCKPTDKCMENIFNHGECEKTKECALKRLQSEVEE